MPRSSKSTALFAPADQRLFRWHMKRSKYIDCLKDYAAQYVKKYKEFYSIQPKISTSIIDKLKEFRDWSIQHSMTPLLFSGTLLGKKTAVLLFIS